MLAMITGEPTPAIDVRDDVGVRLRPTTGLPAAASTMVAIVLASLLGTGCGSLGEPYLGSFPTSSAPAPGDQVNNTDSDGAPVPTVNAPVLALPPRPADYLPSIIVVASAGIGVVDRSTVDSIGRFEPIRLLDLASGPDPTTTAVTTTTEPTGFGGTPTSATSVLEVVGGPLYRVAKDDLFGGLLVQAETGEVVWYPGTGGESRVVAVEDAQFADVGYSAGTPEALTERAGLITRTRLVDNEPLAFTRLDSGEELIDLSSSGGVVAVATSDALCGSVRFYDSEGAGLSIDPFPAFACQQASRPTVGAVAMSPDGEALAYTIVRYREDGVEQSTELRAVELTSGAEIFSVGVGGSGDVIDSVDFDGAMAIMLRRSSASREVLVVEAEQVTSLDVAPAGLPRSVAFARLPLAANLGT
jgi:hypothetical protein